MPIRVTLDEVLGTRDMTGKDLARRIGISETQLSLFRSGKVRGIRFSTLSRMCAVLECRPGDLIDYDHADTDLEASEQD
ncbi:helix-turn-helix domain-containing protein [Porphyrobacter sp. ULC335]|jgi:putative transcriptional regulator|uniref:helix-turn-helix domain-containing protein n=1 Tax=Porphyrobacter sp. ULC335 TaxID=2854260 RepID=UPI002220A441|nr:helix-turn-helix transcriptional regulator [Porphyrobacter sp. ULC335]UYV16592.1 helix-turn-helix transcriptional regulator [Porphyrobacter sp. ULC335]